MIKRIDASQPDLAEVVKKHTRISEPLIIENGLTTLPRWDIDHLESKMGNEECFLRYYGKNKFNSRKNDWHLYIKSMWASTFGEYAEMLRSGTAASNRVYYAQQEIDDTDLDVAPFKAITDKFKMRPRSGFNIWCGPDGHKEPLHYDHADGFLFQVHGNKRIRLFPYSQTKNLYPFPSSVTVGWWFSRVDIDNPDFNSYPNVHKAFEEMIEFELLEGEILFMPWGWWHENTSRGDKMTCSINRFYYTDPWWRSTAMSPRPLLITAVEKFRDLQTWLGVRGKAASRVFTIADCHQRVLDALTTLIPIESWYNQDIEHIDEKRFSIQINRKNILVEISHLGNDKVIWKLDGHKNGLASGQIVYELTKTKMENYVNIKVTHQDVTPSLTKHLNGVLNHSLQSLKGYIETGLGDPFLAG